MRSVVKFILIALSSSLLVACGGKEEKGSEAKISPDVVNNPASATASESDPEAILYSVLKPTTMNSVKFRKENAFHLLSNSKIPGRLLL
jgi:hypothetical protein